MGKAMFTIIGAMAELESALISERVKAGMAAAKVRGKRFGVHTIFVQILSLTYYTHNSEVVREGLLCV